MGIFSGKKHNWMIVTHAWHVDSRGFSHEILVDATPKEAQAYAALKASRKSGTCHSVAGIAIRLPDLVQVVKQSDT